MRISDWSSDVCSSDLAPHGFSGDLFDTPIGADFDGDSATECTATSPVGPVGSVPGCEAFQSRSVGYEKMTGRFVIDYKITDDNLIYASYSRGYKSGGINPPLQPVFAVPESFKPEQVDAFEIGRSEEHTSELQSLIRISYAFF